MQYCRSCSARCRRGNPLPPAPPRRRPPASGTPLPPRPPLLHHTVCSPTRRFAIDTREPEYAMPGAVAGRHFETKKKRRRGSPRQHRTNSDVSITSTTSEASGVHRIRRGRVVRVGVSTTGGAGLFTWRLHAHCMHATCTLHCVRPPPSHRP